MIMHGFSWQFLDDLWDKFLDEKLNGRGEIQKDFFIWKKGTTQQEIFDWFDDRVEGGIVQRYFS